jgi:hypothetical protein
MMEMALPDSDIEATSHQSFFVAAAVVNHLALVFHVTANDFELSLPLP